MEKHWGQIKIWMKRLGIYICGMIIVSTGIVLCVKCGLGISPVSSWPYVMESIVPLSFGTLTMLFHLVNIFFQYLMERKIGNIKVLLQIPVAVLMGFLIDVIKSIITIDTSTFIIQILTLCLSVFFTALGMVCMLNMELIQNPPDGAVMVLSKKTGKEMGKIKWTYDVFMLVTSSIVSFLVLGKLKGLGIATLISAIFVGRVLSRLQKSIGIKLKKMVVIQ